MNCVWSGVKKIRLPLVHYDIKPISIVDTEARNIIDIIQQPYGAYVCWLYWVFCTVIIKKVRVRAIFGQIM